MKKLYIIPSTVIISVDLSKSLLSASDGNGTTLIGDGGKVSEQEGYIESDVKSYSVWDDDWSK